MDEPKPAPFRKIIITMPVLKARVLLLIGDYKSIEYKIPFHIQEFGDHGYLARTVYVPRNSTAYPFNVVIHSRTAAISVIAHEAVHAASFIQSAMGQIGDFVNDELTAYIVQHICEKAEIKLGTYE